MNDNYQLYFEDFQVGLPYQKKPLLQLNNWGLKKGEIHVLTGESGSGKSLTAQAILGLLKDKFILRGSIFFSSSESKKLEINSCSSHNLLSLRRKELGLVIQQPLSAFNPVKRIGPQLYERAMWIFPKRGDQLKESLFLLEKLQFEDPERILNSYPHQLSGGQLQRVAIAMATIVKPGLLIADEPGSALDKVTGEKVIHRLVEQTKNDHTTLLLITHDLESARRIADRITVIKDGHIQETIENKGENLSFSSAYAEDLFSKYYQYYNTDQWSIFKNSNHKMVAHPLNPVIEDLSISYQSGNFFSRRKEVKALQGVSYSFDTPNTGILGRTGSGKSTLGKVLCGLLPPSQGILKFNKQKFQSGIRDKSFPYIQMVFQDPQSAFNPVRKLGKQLKEVVGKTKEKKELFSQMMEQSGIHADLLERHPSQLSGGQLQRLSIIRAVISKPDGIIFDEFVTALDIHWKIEITKMVSDQIFTKGIPYWIISHEKVVLDKLCSTIIQLEDGSIKGISKPSITN